MCPLCISSHLPMGPSTPSPWFASGAAVGLFPAFDRGLGWHQVQGLCLGQLHNCQPTFYLLHSSNTEMLDPGFLFFFFFLKDMLCFVWEIPLCLCFFTSLIWNRRESAFWILVYRRTQQCHVNKEWRTRHKKKGRKKIAHGKAVALKARFSCQNTCWLLFLRVSI